MVMTPIPLPTDGMAFVPKPGRLPFTAIDAYGRRMGWVGDDFALLFKVLQRMDAVWMDIQA